MSEILQLVSGDGTFDVEAVERYLEEAGIRDAGTAYTVVSIMGPQSSGKSTLLNAVVRTGVKGSAGVARPGRPRERRPKENAAVQSWCRPHRDEA